MPKYKFKIKARNNIIVDNLMIIAADYQSAESRLSKMYRFYELLEGVEVEGNDKNITFEDIIDIVAK
jgi:hypothetical protein